MRIIYGDVTTTGRRAIVHGCNSVGVMGAGAANAIAARWPGAEKVYREHVGPLWKTGISTLGTFTSWTEVGEPTIYNLVIQRGYGRGSRFTNYAALASGLIDVAKDFLELHPGFFAIATTKIGCGLGGGDWGIVGPILEDIEQMTDIEFEVYEL